MKANTTMNANKLPLTTPFPASYQIGRPKAGFSRWPDAAHWRELTNGMADPKQDHADNE
jgi:hypothetical protein